MRQLKITQSITNRTPNIERFFNEVEKTKLISASREIELARLIREGNKWAEDELVKANLRFVISVAKQYQSTGAELGDLINDGCVGLVEAAKRYDETRGFKFISYAVWWIRQAIMDGLNKNSRMIRLPGNQLSVIGKYRDALSYLEQKLERQPSSEELCEHLNITPRALEKLTEANLRPLSLDVPFEENESGTLLDIIPDQGEASDATSVTHSIRTQIERAMECLTEREKRVIMMWSGMDIDAPMSVSEMAEEEGISRERIRQIKEKAILKLRKKAGNMLWQALN